jgi:hypothetical protein
MVLTRLSRAVINIFNVLVESTTDASMYFKRMIINIPPASTAVTVKPNSAITLKISIDITLL